VSAAILVVVIVGKRVSMWVVGLDRRTGTWIRLGAWRS
jgi:hypothetical protein